MTVKELDRWIRKIEQQRLIRVKNKKIELDRWIRKIEQQRLIRVKNKKIEVEMDG
jgi:hypothetical protein